MRQNYIFSILTLLVFSSPLFGQITLSNGSFPYLGDTLVSATDNMPSISFDSNQTGEQIWDFQDLVAPFSSELIYYDPANSTAGSEFPNANAFVLAIGDVENYYQITGDEILNLGYFGDDPIGLGFNAVIKFSPPVVERRAPMSYEDSFSSESNALLPFASEDIPFGILDSLPITPDSFRLKINRVTEELVDGYGTVELAIGNFSVLKVRKEQVVTVRLEAKIPFFNWQDVTDLVGLSELLGETEVVSHHFYSNTAKEALVELFMNPESPDDVESVTFKSGGMISSLDPINWTEPSAYVYPNPVYFDAKFEFVNIPEGTYELSIYNIVGTKVLGKQLDISGNKSLKIDVADLSQGTYLYSLETKENQRLFTKKMTVIKP